MDKGAPYEKTLRYLSQVGQMDRMINEKQGIVDSLRNSIMGASASTDRERVQVSPKDRLGETCVEIADLCRQINRDIDRFVDMKAEVMQAIGRYVDDPKQRRLLRMRYLEYIPLPFVARGLHVSIRTAYRLHDEGVWKISKKFMDDTE